tara:strand:+ start:3031 stop:3573 length:543 start_codon:yes stop_codon:yes gene_type:complete
MRKYLILGLFLTILLPFLTTCGIGKKIKEAHKPVDLRNSPLDPDARAKRNIEEGRGISLGSLGDKSTTYEFSTSNPMWRASLETLDFIPMTTVDYSGGMIITDWYSEETSSNQESLKITVRFLSNEIRSDSLKIIVHKKTCKNNNCRVSLLPNNSKIKNELLEVILRKASFFEKEKKIKK